MYTILLRGFAHAPTFFPACARVCVTGSKIDDYSFVFDDIPPWTKTRERMSCMARVGVAKSIQNNQRKTYICIAPRVLSCERKEEAAGGGKKE